MNKKRRQFLKRLLEGTAAATVLLVVRPSPAVGRLLQQKGGLAFVVDIGKCIGCGNCVRACSAENNVPTGFFRTWVERYVRTDEGVYVDSPKGGKLGFREVPEEVSQASEDGWFVPKLCNHCRKSPCVKGCPVGATFRSPEGFVLVDPQRCLGCGYCVQNCPYGARFINPEKKIADKCTWCYHRVKRGKLPACVTVCPGKARLFGDLNDPASEVAKIFKANRWLVLKPAMHTDPRCLYIQLPKEAI